MNTLIVYGHSHKKGHCSTYLEEIKHALDERKVKYEVLDLYSMHFDPVLKDFEVYNTEEEKKMHKEVQKLQKKVSDAERLIFIYPVWWNSVPAIMKGFFDRVFSAGFAFKYYHVIGNFWAPRGLLKGKRAAIFLSTGSPAFLFWLVQGGRGSTIIRKDVLSFCGIKAKTFHHGDAFQFKEEAKADLRRKAIKGVDWLCR